MKARPTKLAAGLVIGAVALFGVGTNVQAGWVLVIAALILGFVIAGAALPVLALRGVEVTREAPPSGRSGERLGVTVTVTNTSRGLRGMIGVHDRFCGHGWAVCGLLRPGQSRSFTDLRSGARRGIHTSGTTGLASGAPFGVLIAWRDVEVRTSTTIYPKVFPVVLPDPTHGDMRMVRTPEGDTASLRDYRPGDPLRHVHWRSTARRGELMVREFEEAEPAKVVVVADTSDDADAVDAIASAATSFAREALDIGLRVDLVHLQRTEPASASNTVDAWGASLATHNAANALEVPATSDATLIVVAAAEKRNRALGEALSGVEATVVLVDRRSPEAPQPTPLGVEIAASLRTGGHRVVVVPATEDLGEWLH